MKKTIEEYYCDICGKKINKEFIKTLPHKNDDGTITLSIVFVTEQTEGMHCTPYICIDKLHICEKCYYKIINDGKQIFGSGAMGDNKYWFK